MRALAFLLGARAIDLAAQRARRPGRGAEPEMLPFASTPERARAWRRWAEAGRIEAVASPGSAPLGARPAAALKRGAI